MNIVVCYNSIVKQCPKKGGQFVKAVFFIAKKGADDMELTLKQKRFADEYIISGNATEAAIKAGYKEKAAYQTGAENLKKPQIKSYIDESLKELEAAKFLTIEEALKITASIARGEPREVEVVDIETGENYTKKVYPNFKDSNAALDHFYKINGSYIEKREVKLESNGLLEDILEQLDG